MIAGVLATAARTVAGSSVRWTAGTPEGSARIYIANHTSHLDFILIWSYLPAAERRRVRPVAAADYWSRGFKRFLARRVFNSLLIQRRSAAGGDPRHLGEVAVEQMAAALHDNSSLILFPEGTRSDDGEMKSFRSGLFHLCVASPEIEVVPVHLDNLNRIMPKGAILPIPLLSRITFGAGFRIEPGEARDAFLERARQRVLELE